MGVFDFTYKYKLKHIRLDDEAASIKKLAKKIPTLVEPFRQAIQDFGRNGSWDGAKERSFSKGRKAETAFLHRPDGSFVRVDSVPPSLNPGEIVYFYRNPYTRLTNETFEPLRQHVFDVMHKHGIEPLRGETGITGDYDYCDLGTLFLQLLKTKSPVDVSYKLPNGFIADASDIACVLIVFHCEQLFWHLRTGKANDIVRHMWSLREAKTIIDNRHEDSERLAKAQQKAREMNELRHETNHKIRDLVIEQWEATRDKYHSRNEASSRLADWLVLEKKKVKTIDQRTVDGYLVKHFADIGFSYRKRRQKK